MQKPMYYIAGIVVLLSLVIFVVTFSMCKEERCLYFEWQKIRVTNNFETCARLGFPIEESYPRRCQAGTKTFTEDIGKNQSSSVDNIHLFAPVAQSTVSSPLVIKGEARVFENVVLYRVKDENGTILAQGSTLAQSPDIGLFGPFSTEVAIPLNDSQDGTLEVFTSSPKDGSEINKITIPIVFVDDLQASPTGSANTNT